MSDRIVLITGASRGIGAATAKLLGHHGAAVGVDYYGSEEAAEAILYAAEHPKRDMLVGFQAKFFAVLAGLASRLMNKLMEVWAFPTQQSDRPSALCLISTINMSLMPAYL